MNILEEIPKTKSSSSSYFSFNKTSDPTPLNSPPPQPASVSSVNSEPSFSSSSWSIFDARSFIILILLALIIMTYFGINVLNVFGDTIQKSVDVVSPFVSQILDLIGNSTGSVVNKTAEVSSDVAKEGVDIAEGTVKSIGNIMIGEDAIGRPQHTAYMNDPVPDSPEDNIQKSLSSAKTKWCLVGEYQNKRGCIDLSESDKCLSGQVFPNEEMCLNPSMMTKTNGPHN